MFWYFGERCENQEKVQLDGLFCHSWSSHLSPQQFSAHPDQSTFNLGMVIFLTVKHLFILSFLCDHHENVAYRNISVNRIVWIYKICFFEIIKMNSKYWKTLLQRFSPDLSICQVVVFFKILIEWGRLTHLEPTSLMCQFALYFQSIRFLFWISEKQKLSEKGGLCMNAKKPVEISKNTNVPKVNVKMLLCWYGRKKNLLLANK